MKTNNGYTLFETETIAVIATGITRKSTNAKTGAMIQIYIIDRNNHPVESIKTGADSVVCLDCIHRGTDGFTERSCYVTMNGIIAVFNAYKRGVYKFLPFEDYASVFAGRAVRFGTYGDPCLIPLAIMRRIAVLSARHSGYTHQWDRGIDGEYMQYLMASCDRPQDADKAHSMGFRTFRVNPGKDFVAAGEIICPSESRGHHCVDCKLCTGAISGAKSILISVHGAGAKHLQTKLDRLVQIGA